MECERLAKCPFFADKLPKMPNLAAIMKEKYCLGEKASCARYQIAGAGLPVPPDLFPDENARASQIIQCARA